MTAIYLVKKTICSYLCVGVIILGTISLLPTTANAKLIKKSINIVLVDSKSESLYRNKKDKKIETISGGKSLTGEAGFIVLIIGLILIAAAFS